MSQEIILQRGVLVASILLVSLTQGCGWLEPNVDSGSVLFQDDFSRLTSGWDRYRDEVYDADYVGDAYRIAVFRPDTEVWSRPHLSLSNVRIEVITTKVSGPDDNLYGVICRYQDAGNFYFFVISSDGYAGIGMHKHGEETLLSSDTMQPAHVIQRGNSNNLIRASCIDEELSLHVNDTLVASVQASTWNEGDVGLIVGTYSQPAVEIVFDNFSVQKP
ncbi:MAG: hypothetical protein GTO14_02540 [Anaerolineales bacterium]|nr:hypothetical protein [Anaerolineales bacterium]